MRLLNVETFDTEEFFGKPIPRYTILSHTWGEDKDETTLYDIKAGRIKEAEARPAKLAGCCKQTREDGLRYTWVDTCCINKDSATELGEAINSMFKWYINAEICYVYLSDVPPGGPDQDSAAAFASSRWFTRGWTLQELLAPHELRFYSAAWSPLGTRTELSATIAQITGIARPFLLGVAPLREASVAQRMSWASRRTTKREEDMAYSLLGIFEVAMPMNYGEGANAFVRLEEEIMKHTGDDSILAWGLGTGDPELRAAGDDLAGPILAAAPADFANCACIVPQSETYLPPEVLGGRLRVQFPLHTAPGGKTYGLLHCGPDSQMGQVVGIPLAKRQPGSVPNEYFRPQGQRPILLPAASTSSPSQQLCLLLAPPRGSMPGLSRKHWFYLEDTSEVGLELIDVAPAERWQKGRSIITTDPSLAGGVLQRAAARFRLVNQESYDFLVLLELGVQSSGVEAQGHAMICSREITLEGLSRSIDAISPTMLGKREASNGVLSIGVSILPKPIGGQQMFAVTLVVVNSPATTINATEELRLLKLQSDVAKLLREVDHTNQKEKEYNQSRLEQDGRSRDIRRRLRRLSRSLERLGQEKAELNAMLSADSQASRQNTHKTEIEATRERLKGAMSEIRRDFKVLSRLDTNAASAGADYGQEILLWAAMEGHGRLVGQLEIEARDACGLSPLSLAARHGHAAVVELLLERGADMYLGAGRRYRVPIDLAHEAGHEAIA